MNFLLSTKKEKKGWSLLSPLSLSYAMLQENERPNFFFRFDINVPNFIPRKLQEDKGSRMDKKQKGRSQE